MSIKDITEKESLFFTGNRKEVIIDNNGQNLTFYANAISFFENQNIGIQARLDRKNGLALLIAASITDSEGNNFTYDEVLKLKEEIAKPLLDAALEVNAPAQQEKK